MILFEAVVWHWFGCYHDAVVILAENVSYTHISMQKVFLRKPDGEGSDWSVFNRN